MIPLSRRTALGGALAEPLAQRPEVGLRGRVAQGAADLVMGLSGALGSLAAGPLFHAGAFGLLGAGAAALGLGLILVASRARPAVTA